MTSYRMYRNWTTMIAMTLACVAGCRSGSHPESAPPVSDVSTNDRETPVWERTPGDRLTARQVEMYLAVRERAASIRGNDDRADPLSLVAGLPTAQSDAIDELGFTPSEFRRVAAIIDAARSMTQTSSDEILDAIDASSRARLAEFPGQPAANEVRLSAESQTHNLDLLERFRERLAALDVPLAAAADPQGVVR